MTPDFRVVAETTDITEVIRERLLSLRVVDEAGWQSDTLEIKLDDRSWPIELPRHGAQLIVHLGYKQQGLTRMGVYTVDEVSLEGPPDTLTIRARAANFRKSLKEQKTRGWDGITLGDIVTTIAKEHDLEPVISETLKEKLIQRIDQTDESDLHFLTRLAKEHGAISKPIENRLLFVPRGEARTASQQPMQEVNLSKLDLTRYTFSLADRGKYEAVIAHWHDSQTGNTQPVKVGDKEARPIFTLKGLQPDADAAQNAAKAKLEALRRGQATGSLSLPGQPVITAETRLNLSGIKKTINGHWIVTRAEHELGQQGLNTRLNIETPNP